MQAEVTAHAVLADEEAEPALRPDDVDAAVSRDRRVVRGVSRVDAGSRGRRSRLRQP